MNTAAGGSDPAPEGRATVRAGMEPAPYGIDPAGQTSARRGGNNLVGIGSAAPAAQYFGTLWSISSDQALMPPLTLFTYLKPCSFKKLSALSERTPLLQ